VVAGAGDLKDDVRDLLFFLFVFSCCTDLLVSHIPLYLSSW